MLCMVDGWSHHGVVENIFCCQKYPLVKGWNFQIPLTLMVKKTVINRVKTRIRKFVEETLLILFVAAVVAPPGPGRAELVTFGLRSATWSWIFNEASITFIAWVR